MLRLRFGVQNSQNPLCRCGTIEEPILDLFWTKEGIIFEKKHPQPHLILNSVLNSYHEFKSSSSNTLQVSKYKHFVLVDNFKYFNRQIECIYVKRNVCIKLLVEIEGGRKMKKIVKVSVNQQLYDAFIQKLRERNYESQSEWLREKIRKFVFEGD